MACSEHWEELAGTHSQFFVQWPEMRAGPKDRAAARATHQ